MKKSLGVEKFGLGRKFWVRAKFFGSGENFWFGRKYLVRAKILGSGEKFWFGRKFFVRAKILGSGKNVGFGQKFLVWAKFLDFAFCIMHLNFPPKILNFSEFLDSIRRRRT